MKYEDELYEIEEVAEEVETEASSHEANSKKKVKRPHNYQVRRKLEDYLEDRDLRIKVDYFDNLL
jgi:hypothetical protein